MRRIIDLSFPIHEGMRTFPSYWHPKVEIRQLGRHRVEKRESRKVVLGTHTGTHVDAASHFIPGGRSVDKIPLSILVGEATVVDLSNDSDSREISAADLRKALQGRKARRLVVRTGWSSHWKRSDYYSGYPYFSTEAIRWLLRRGLKLLALDTPSPDNPKNKRGNRPDSPNHKILLGSGVVLVEYLCNLEQVRANTIEFIALPLRLRNADGAPARCIAIE